ncbi:Protein AGENET DOMAIN (AGD)-CONTAINING P1 [Linum perenne]
MTMKREALFRRGDHVEVFSDAEGFLGSYFEGHVVELVGSSPNQYKVEYTNLTETEDEGSELLKETVSEEQIRPYPPRVRFGEGGFRVREAVDVLHNEGWWVGRVTGRTLDGMMYYVYFETTGEEIAYPVSMIRVHLDWIDGNWVQPKSRKQAAADFGIKQTKKIKKPKIAEM